jgi:hypothetical protein
MNKSEFFTRITSIVILTTFVASFLYWRFDDNQKVVEPIKRAAIIDVQQPNLASTVEQLTAAIEQLPDGGFKANLYVVLATEYAGDTEILKQILQEFARLQMEKLQKKKTI